MLEGGHAHDICKQPCFCLGPIPYSPHSYLCPPHRVGPPWVSNYIKLLELLVTRIPQIQEKDSTLNKVGSQFYNKHTFLPLPRAQWPHSVTRSLEKLGLPSKAVQVVNKGNQPGRRLSPFGGTEVQLTLPSATLVPWQSYIIPEDKVSFSDSTTQNECLITIQPKEGTFYKFTKRCCIY